jgi:FkbM family methyltransferase
MTHTESALFAAVQEAPLYRRGGLDPALGRRPVAVFCAAEEEDAALSSLRSMHGIDPACVCFWPKDGEVRARGAAVPLVSMEELGARPELLVWLYGKSERAKGVALTQHGVVDFVFAQDPPYKDLRYQPSLLQEQRERLEEVWSLLADDESRRTFASIIKHRIRGEHGFLRIARYPEYSHPLVKAEPGETVVDGGAFNGKTSIAFALQATGGRVVAFEPDPTNQQSILALLQKSRLSTSRRKVAAAQLVKLAPYALYDSETSLRFRNDKRQSSAVSDGSEQEGIEVQAIPLDTYVKRQAMDRVDLVSLDVEGAEEKVMAGMRETIDRHRPKLQISIYHQKDHLYTLPLLAQSLCRDYAFFLGHHNTYSTETDLYAVPRERLK